MTQRQAILILALLGALLVTIGIIAPASSSAVDPLWVLAKACLVWVIAMAVLVAGAYFSRKH